MSGARFLLLFVGDEGPVAWLRLADGLIADRGMDAAGLVAEGDEQVVLVVPGAEVNLAWIELPAASGAQARAAARLIAAERSADAVERLHVALGVAGASGKRCVAVAETSRVAAWLNQAQALGFDPDIILPEPLLISPREQRLRCWEKDGLQLLRGEETAFAAEPELAALIAEGRIEPIEEDCVAAEMPEALARMPVNLRQGGFAKRRRWRPAWSRLRRSAALGAAILVVSLLIPAALTVRCRVEAARLERETAAVAASVLPGGMASDPAARLRARLVELRGGGLGFDASAALLYASLRDTPNVELSAFMFEKDGTLRATLLAATEADVDGVQRRLEESGMTSSVEGVRAGGGRRIAELRVTAR